MQLSNIPGKLVLPFANAGGKSTIPVASQIGITAGAASLTDGFPPLTRTPIAAGGVPPSGLDMNGILYEMSAIVRWANAGGGYPFDSIFATDTNVGGYPKGARIMRADGAGYWYNTTDNNVTDPESAGAAAAGWVPDFTTGVAAVTMTSANVTLTPAQYGKSVIVISGALTANLNLIFPPIVGSWGIINNTTGNFTITAKTDAGNGVAIGNVMSVYGDGSNIYSTLAPLANTTDMRQGVALVGGAARVVTSIAALKALPKTACPNASVSGYYAAGDGGGGEYWFDASDTTSADNGGSIIVATDGGRWKLLTHGRVSVRQFGAKCLPTIDDHDAVQNAVNYCLTFDPPAILSVPGMCRLDSSVHINRLVDDPLSATFFRIQGDGIGSGFYAYVGVTLFSAFPDNLTVPTSQKINFDRIVFKSEFPSNEVYVVNGQKFLRMRFTNCDFHRLKILTCARYLQSYYFDNCTSYGWLGTLFNGTNGAYDVKFNNCMIEAGGSFLNITCEDVNGADPVAGCSVTNSLIESLSGDAIVIDRAQGFAVDNVYFEGNGGVDLKFDTARNLANLTPNGSIKVTGCFFSPTVANYTDPTYYAIRWGRTANAFAAANFITQGTRLHKLIAETRSVILGDVGQVAAISTDEFVYSAGGYVQPGTGGERLKTIRGTVEANGAISSGSGFTVTKGETGIYTINFTTAFSGTPSTAVDLWDSNGTACTPFVSSSAASAGVLVRTTANVAVNSKFEFTAIGPA